MWLAANNGNACQVVDIIKKLYKVVILLVCAHETDAILRIS